MLRAMVQPTRVPFFEKWLQGCMRKFGREGEPSRLAGPLPFSVTKGGFNRGGQGRAFVMKKAVFQSLIVDPLQLGRKS